jgi:hypothetical protein
LMRRAFKEFIQLGPGVSQLEGGTQFRPGHTEPAPTRRSFKQLIQVGGDSSDSSQCTTRYFDSTGLEIWHRNHGATVRDVSIDASGNMYEVGDVASGVSVRKRSPTGVPIWEKSHGANLTVCALTPSGGIVVGGAAGTDGHRVRQYAADGALDWSADTPYDVNSLDVDRDGTVIVSCLSHPGLSASPTLSIVTFFDTAGAILSQGDYSYNDPTSPVEIRAIIAVAFSENVLYPYTVSPTLRWLSAIQRVRQGDNSWWVVSLNGNTEISSSDGAQPVNGAVTNVVQRRCTGTYARLATTAGADGDTTADMIYGVLGGHPNTDQQIHGGSVHAIQRNGRMFAATSAVQAFDPQTPVHGVLLTDPWVTKPWKSTSTWIADHHGAILGVDVNDSGNSVIGGVVATV